MIFRNNTRFARAVTLITIMGIAGHLSARENVGTPRPKGQLKTTAAGCQPAQATIDLDINNVRARLMTGGDMWWNQGAANNAAYEIPKGSGRHSQFAASCWIGGFDKQGQLKVAAQTYRQDGNDYWPGALNNDGKITADTCSLWDHFWKIDRSRIKAFIQAYKVGADTKTADYDVINGWPAKGNTSAGYGVGPSATKLYLNPNNTYAPFVDADGDGKYNPNNGDYPNISGDQYIWWVFNDAGNIKQQSLTAAMGIEVQTSAFAYATQDFLNNSTFCNYRVINRGPLTIDSTYIAVWDDCDLGYYLDDYIGCDTSRGLGIMYNATNNDGQSGGNPSNSYGLNPPQVGLDFFQGPKRIKKINGKDSIETLKMTNFTYFNNDATIIGNPTNGIQIYYYMTGSIRTGQRFSNDFQGPGIPSKGYGAGPISNFVFGGDPSDNSQWSECSCTNPPGDRRFIFSSGPFELVPGAVNDITFGCIWAAGVGGCGQTSFKTIQGIDDGAQRLFIEHFKTVEGPEAPDLNVRELDRRLVFYLTNRQESNNFGENYGRSDGVYNDSLQYHQVSKGNGISKDTLYHFEGYRVFQLANSQVTSAEIFDPNTGEVDKTKAVEVFQCDIHNGVKQIVNYTKNISVSDTTHIAQVKVNGRDSGIVHSFQLTQDQFASGTDKRFINYHNYYFVAVAYAYNNFANFDPNPIRTTQTQDVPYLGSAHGGGGVDIKVVAALPNPANGDMGTVLNADFGSTPAITRVEGVGNGGNDVQLDSASEATILLNNSIDRAVYTPGNGPIKVKVIDPVKVVPMDWALQIKGDSIPSVLPNLGNGIYGGTATWTLTGTPIGGGLPVTVYSERNLDLINEQILKDYGISVAVGQVLPPGADQTNGNAYISSSVSFDDPSQPWLWGVKDLTDSSFANWLRSGNTKHFQAPSNTNPCQFNDARLDTNGAYANMLANFTPTKSTWGPYSLAAWFYGGHYGGTQSAPSPCGFEIAAYQGLIADFKKLNDVDIVFTNDKSKWTRCAVVEEQEDQALSQDSALKFFLRKHKSWNLKIADDGNTPIYSEDATDKGMSWFPGYAIDQGTGQRLNIVFGEDSYLSGDHGNDMIWNPTSSFTNGLNIFDASIIFGGRHVVYVLGSKYDSDKVFVANIKAATPVNTSLSVAYSAVRWTGIPFLNPTLKLASLKDGIIPGAPLPGNAYTQTRLRFRVDRPYAPFAAVDTTTNFAVAGTTVEPGKASFPYYTFSTKELAPSKLSDTSDRNKLLSRIFAVPNPYYGYSGYEKTNSRFDTKVRIINLPAKATIYIYSLDGSLVRTLSKSDQLTSYIDWDIRNSAGLPIASGMYLMDVKAEGIGETVIRWFGSLRPLDVTSY